MAHMIEYLLYKLKALSSKLQFHQKHKTTNKTEEE
jgi:hypothetical protein